MLPRNKSELLHIELDFLRELFALLLYFVIFIPELEFHSNGEYSKFAAKCTIHFSDAQRENKPDWHCT